MIITNEFTAGWMKNIPQPRHNMGRFQNVRNIFLKNQNSYKKDRVWLLANNYSARLRLLKSSTECFKVVQYLHSSKEIIL